MGMGFANQTADDFPSLKAYAKTLSQTSMNAMQAFQPQTTFKNYTDSPSQISLYKDTKEEKVDLSGAGREALSQDKAGQAVVDAFGNHQVSINKNNPAIAQALLIEAESYAITHGVSNDRVHCEADEKPSCTKSSHEEICHASRLLPKQSCQAKRVIKVDSDIVNSTIYATIVVKKSFKGFVTLNLVTGGVSNAVSASVSRPLSFAHGCQSMSVSIAPIRNNAALADWVSVIGMPSCKNNGTLTLNITHDFKREYPLQISMNANVVSNAYVTDEHWDNDDCRYLEDMRREGLCSLSSEVCSNALNPVLINGLSLSRDCWDVSREYSCRSGKADECASQVSRGCLQTSSKCTRYENGGCADYEQSYQCTENTCIPPITCTHDVFCADGECVDKIATKSTNVGESMAALAGANAMGRDYSKTQSTLFGGHEVQCKIWVLGLIDCCADTGWGKAINLLHCREEDKALGQAKLDYLAHYLGEYCATEELGVCLENKRRYCVFDTKIARIMQEEGRLKQLNPNALGTPEKPACEGMSIAEMQKLDMGKIDFLTPTYPAFPAPDGEPLEAAGISGDFHNTLPTDEKSREELTRRLQQKAGL